MKFLSPEEIPSSQDLLLDVFRDGYTDSYVGDERFLHGYLQRAHIAILDDRTESLNGAALIRNSRITAAAPRTDREAYGSRFQNYVGLLETAHSIKDDAWLGIGLDVKESVRAAAEQAGMTRSRNEALLMARLEKTGRMSSFAIQSCDNGLLISLAGSNHGDNYWQEVWDWDPK